MGQVSVHLVSTGLTLPITWILTLPGIVVAAHDENDEILNKRVFLVPTRGWEKDPLAPEAPYGNASLVPNYTLRNSCHRFGLLGGGENPPIGTFSTYCVVSREQVIPTPSHLDDVHAAAWPVAGVTAWR